MEDRGEQRADKRAGRDSLLNSPKESVSALKYLGCNLMSIGNNHITDDGKEGLLETIKIFSSLNDDLAKRKNIITKKLILLNINFLG